MTKDTEYEERVEARARVIADQAQCGTSAGKETTLCISPTCLCREQARATMAQDEADGYALVKRKATKETAAKIYSGYPGDSMSQGRVRANAAIEAGRVKENDE